MNNSGVFRSYEELMEEISYCRYVEQDETKLVSLLRELQIVQDNMRESDKPIKSEGE